MSRKPSDGKHRAGAPRDIEAARLRAKMQQAVFKRPAEQVCLGRFKIVKRLGGGAMGLVYEVIDPRTQGHFALKTIRSSNPRALGLFKREFRSLARVTHPNLVTLYELGRDGSTFFFTMELIRGVTLLRYLWGLDSPPTPNSELPPSPVLDFSRLRRVLSQLVASIAALHELGKLHRDIKPTNVMVTAEGRVVLMDFGFVSDQLGNLLESTQGSLILGTPAFMPPEQSRAERLTAAADWYSVGATLYLALTGQAPYSGLAMAEMLLLKETQAPTHPRLLARGIPADLGDLCVDLLAPDPADRPDEATILRRTAAAAWIRGGATPSTGKPRPRRRKSSTFGLTLPLNQLRRAYLKNPEGLRIARVVAASGQGKSRLVAHFLEQVRRETEGQKPLILRTRCNPGDAVPAQAIDALVDGLARHLRLLNRNDLCSILPKETDAIVRVFPVLSQVPALAGRAHAAPARDAAFAALRHLFIGIASLRPIILWIDDLQWSDTEGLRRLAGLLAPPDPPPLMIILSYRSEDADTRPELAQLINTVGGEQIEIEPLSAEEAVALAASLTNPDADIEVAEQIASEAEHSPLWIHELALLVAQGIHEPTLADLVGHRIRDLPRVGVKLVSLAAIAQRPLPLALATAAGIREQVLYASLRRAIAAHLLRLSITAKGEQITPFDERIRTAILSHLDGPGLREQHRRLAAAIETRGTDEPELLIHHLRGAGELDRAQHYALMHAQQRAARGNHLGAAQLFRLAHELGHEDARGAALLRRQSEALAAAGHETEAAHVLLRALTDLEAEEALNMRLYAARLLLTNGEQEAGQKVLVRVFADLHLPSLHTTASPLGALLRRGRLRLRGSRYRERNSADLSRRELLQVDAAWAASSGLLGENTELAKEAQARHLQRALKVGEPLRIARALALESLRLAIAGDDLRRAADLQARAAEIATREDATQVRALAAICLAAIVLQRGPLSEAMLAADAALAQLQKITVCNFEHRLARALRLETALLTGDLADARRKALRWSRETTARCSFTAAADLEIDLQRLALAAGEDPPAPVSAPTGEPSPNPSQTNLDLLSWSRCALRCGAMLAAGEGELAWTTIDSRIRSGKIDALVFVLAVDLRARAGLLVGGERLKDVDRDCGLLRQHPHPIAGALSTALASALAIHRGAPPEKILGPSADALDAAGLHLRALLCRWSLSPTDSAERHKIEIQLGTLGVLRPPQAAALLLALPT
ncbi:MAG TPA: hypothetical protein ENJ18_08275 [Nannocystis exedens]|nr:hypothetical protein [Nannocystis exedens]